MGNISIIGGAAVGVITSDNLGHEGYQVGVVVLPDDLAFNTVAVGASDKGEKNVGLEMEINSEKGFKFEYGAKGATAGIGTTARLRTLTGSDNVSE